MVAGERRTWRMLEADVWFRYSWEGRSEVSGKVGISWLKYKSILSVDEILVDRGRYRYEAAMCVDVSLSAV